MNKKKVRSKHFKITRKGKVFWLWPVSREWVQWGYMELRGTNIYRVVLDHRIIDDKFPSSDPAFYIKAEYLIELGELAKKWAKQ